MDSARAGHDRPAGVVTTMGEFAERMRRKLEAAFTPTRLEIVDDSHRHAGHVGDRPGGETHFNVTIVSHAFTGMNRVARQRQVYAAVAEEMKERVHALQLRTLAPDED
jgi:BolA family transcriptional regulator, general stress-responsive regulator